MKMRYGFAEECASIDNQKMHRAIHVNTFTQTAYLESDMTCSKGNVDTSIPASTTYARTAWWIFDTENDNANELK